MCTPLLSGQHIGHFQHLGAYAVTAPHDGAEGKHCGTEAGDCLETAGRDNGEVKGKEEWLA